MSDTEARPLFLGGGGKAPVWINIGLMLAIVATTSAGVYKFGDIEHAVDRANLSLVGVERTLSKIEAKQNLNVNSINAATNSLGVLRAQVDAHEARFIRLDAKIDQIESRVRDHERAK